MEWRGGSRAKANICTSQRHMSMTGLCDVVICIVHHPSPLHCLVSHCLPSIAIHYKLIGTMCTSSGVCTNASLRLPPLFNKKEKNVVFTLKISKCQPTHPNIKGPHMPRCRVKGTKEGPCHPGTACTPLSHPQPLGPLLAFCALLQSRPNGLP